MAPVDVIATVIGGREATRAVDRSAALVGYESSQARPKTDDIDFIDYPFRSGGSFAEHLAIVENEQPKYAVAPDISNRDDLEPSIEQADRLDEHAETVIVVPKAVHPTEVPDRFRVGVPLANWDQPVNGNAGEQQPEEWVDHSGQPVFHRWTDYQDAAEVHVLGGSPTIQLALDQYYINVESVDGSAVFVGAGYGDWWTAHGWQNDVHDQSDYYGRVTASLNNIVDAWADRRGHSSPVDPADLDPEIVVDDYDDPQAYPDPDTALGYGRPPEIDERDLWDPLDVLPGETSENWRVEQAALDALDDTMRNNDDDDDDNGTYNAIDEWSDGQRGLFGGPASGQSSFDAPAPSDESVIDSIEEVNEGGLLGDTRENVGEAAPTAQDVLFEPSPEQQREEGQGGLFDPLDDEDEDDEDESDESTLLRTGFKKTRLDDLPGIGSGTVDKLPEGVATVAGVADYYRPGGPDPHPQITRRNREAIEDTLTDDQLDTLQQAIEEYADRYEWTVDFENPEDEDEDWTDAFNVPEATDAPEYVGEWTRDDSEPHLTYEHDGYRVRVKPSSADGSLAVVENLYSSAATPDEKIESYHGDGHERRAKKTVINWIKVHDPEDAHDFLPNYVQDRDPALAHFPPDDRGRIKHHAERDDVGSLLRSIHSNIPMGVRKNLADAGIETAGDFVDHYEEHGDFEAVEGIGPKTSEKVEAAIPLIEKGLIARRVNADDEDDEDDDDADLLDPIDEPEPDDDDSEWRDYSPALGDRREWKGGGGGGSEIVIKSGHSGSYILTYRNFTAKAIGESFTNHDDAIEHAEAVMADYSPEDLAEWIEEATGSAADAAADPIGTVDDDQEDADDQDESDSSRSGQSDREKLLTVDGIGPAKADTLLDEFGDLQSISHAASNSPVSIARLDGFSPNTSHDLEGQLKDADVFVGDDQDESDESSTDDLREQLVDLGVPGQAADTLAGNYFHLDDILDHTDAQLLNEEGVGPATIDTLREADDTPDLFADGWHEAIRALRSNYGDGYGDRVEVGADIMRTVENPPQEAAGEGVLQPILRYQSIDPDDVYNQIENKHGEDTAQEVREAIVEYWEESGIDESIESSDDAQEADLYDPLELPDEWGPNATYPTPEDELLDRDAEHFGIDPDESIWSDRDERQADKEDPNADDEFEAMMGQVYDPTEDEPDGLYPDASRPQHVNGWDLDDRLGAHPRWIGGTHPTRTNWREYVEIRNAGDGVNYTVEHTYRYDGERVWEEIEHRVDNVTDAILAATEYMEANEPTSAVEQPTIPETIAGYELDEESENTIVWTGTNGGTAPATFDHGDDWITTVRVRSHGGRYEARFTADAVFNQGDRSSSSTFGGTNLTFPDPDEGKSKNRARTIEQAIAWMEDNPAETDMSTTDTDDEQEQGIEFGTGGVEDEAKTDTTAIEFGNLSTANKWRDDLADGTLTDDDDRRTKTIKLYTGALSDRELAEIERDAADSRGTGGTKYGQAQLDRRETRELQSRSDYQPTDRFKAQSVKAIYQAEGVNPWIDYFDPTLSVDEHRTKVEQDQLDAQDLATADTVMSDEEIDETVAEHARAAAGSECSHAEGYCEHGDEDACEFLHEHCGYSDEEIEELQTQVEAFEEEMAEMSTETPDTADVDVSDIEADELPGYALGTLKKAWGGYRRAAHDAKEHLEAAEQYAESREEAARFGAIINEVRQAHGQEPIEIEAWAGHDEPVALADLPELTPGKGDPVDEDVPGDQSVSWSQRTIESFGASPYDPMEDLA